VIADLPPLQGGVMGFLGYDVVREVESLPNVPHDDRHMPDGVMSVIGSLAAFDHWRQRVYLIESVPVVGQNSQTFTTDELNRLYDEASVRALNWRDHCRIRRLNHHNAMMFFQLLHRQCPMVPISGPLKLRRNTFAPATFFRSCYHSVTNCN
jgi:anthranilate/para-aminobenzoate synthase component I